MIEPCIILFARAPRLGCVKRRLAAGIGAVPALRFYRNQLARIARQLRLFKTVTAVTPRHARWPGQIRPAIAQRGPNLGQRMHNAFKLFPARPVILIGADIPALDARILRAAIKALASHAAVFGPAEDGGYYLVGMGRRRPETPFANVRWSTSHALADTLQNFRRRKIALLPTLTDIDTPENFQNQRHIPHCGAAQNTLTLALVAESVSLNQP
jgi:rSAM/selenodomain-associated transferase 1